jgi:hypothetical protein
MERGDSHPTREELLMAADGELSPKRAERLQEHLSACWECRSQMRDLEAAIGDYVRLYRRNLDPAIPPVAGPRALLKAQLRELASSEANRSRNWIDRVAWRRGFAAISAVCLVAYALLLARQEWVAGRELRPDVPAVAVTIPDARLTPGVAVATSKEEVCKESPPKNKIVPISLQRRVFGAYGIDRANPGTYEVDYLITPALGGSDDIRNLWPQTYAAATWNAQVKDALEDRLHQLVCTGALDLSTAQRDISRDWIAAYKYYFHTDKPIGEPSR